MTKKTGYFSYLEEDYEKVVTFNGVTICTNGYWVDVAHTPCAEEGGVFVESLPLEKEYKCSLCEASAPAHATPKYVKASTGIGDSGLDIWVAKWLNIDPERVEVRINGTPVGL